LASTEKDEEDEEEEEEGEEEKGYLRVFALLARNIKAQNRTASRTPSNDPPPLMHARKGTLDI